ncbi:signal peptidase I [Salipaludibacillus aurantiacus]|uniref:Signal peptidase I n=1 Tax=Salipaludibacillus aurantiacus TaxID=1601833 RepID=A0A1H9UD99_9BACI|nr:signal peptidase I [Salipaludibacillus aurantiacus]SES07043.1 signal peptidase, endoplasmic reticulum-type [Salipaludibacillus aurantiacus]
MKKTVNSLLTAVLLVIFLAAGFVIYQTNTASDEPPSILGYKTFIVLTGSMRPTLEPGDLVISKTPDQEESIGQGDVITYKNDQGVVATHRVIDVLTHDGQTVFQTQGDANNSPDNYVITMDQIYGSQITHIPKFGYVLNYAGSTAGIITLIVLPLIYLFFSEIVTKNRKKNKAAGKRGEEPSPTDTSL